MSRGERRPVPSIDRWLLTAFHAYARHYVRGHIHAIRAAGIDRAASRPDVPLIVFSNHGSWWDALIGLVISRAVWPDRTFYVPIDSRALAKYKFFARLGFVGIELGTRQGARDFLEASSQVLKQQGGALWITPQGRFADARERPLRFKPGLGWLAAHLKTGVLQPVAMELGFWEERTPEALVRFGDPISLDGGSADSVEAWTARLETVLSHELDLLAEAVIARRGFDTLMEGRAGVGGVYDWWRRAASWCGGRSFNPRHGR